jgi:hypothetical protein
MSTILDEEYQRFEFGNRWQIFRYDSAESGYHAIRDSIPHTKSTDFLGVFDGRECYVIEIKDFRGYRIRNKKRLTTGELAEEVSQKVRDTLAGVFAGCRANNLAGCWRDVERSLATPNCDVRIVLWLEDDAAVNPLRWKQELSTQTQLIKRKLHWLRVKVFAVSQSTYNLCPPQLNVSNLAGACGTAR